ncbi:hypothetical protein IAR50_006624 [Cryptococcus sp. DSM 104548]
MEGTQNEPSPLPKKTKVTRSKNGCLVCRSRRVKCDIGKPECERCIKYGAEPKLSLPPPIVPSSSSRQSPPPHHHHPATDVAPLHKIRAMDPFELLMALCRDTRMGQFFSGPVDPPDFLKEAFPVADDLRCFHHCFTYTLSTFVIHEDPNPWLDYVIPLLLFASGETPLCTGALRMALLAVGAVHLASLEDKGSAPDSGGHTGRLGLNYRNEAIRLLRMAQHVPVELRSDTFLAASMMISGADLLGAHPRWRETLRLAHASVRYRGGCEAILFGDRGSESPLPLRVCLIEFLALVDLSVSMTTGDPCVVITESSDWWEKLQSRDPSVPDSVESTTGYHRTIMKLTVRANNILFEACHRSKYISPPSPSSAPTHRPNLPQRILNLSSDLEAWRNDILPTITDKRTKDGSLALWNGIQIMVHRELLGRRREEEVVQRLAEDILDICANVGPKVEYMNWPLLIACTVLYAPQQRQRAREIIKSFMYQCSYELDVVEKVSEECWRRMDEGMDDEACMWREILVEIGSAVMLG